MRMEGALQGQAGQVTSLGRLQRKKELRGELRDLLRKVSVRPWQPRLRLIITVSAVARRTAGVRAAQPCSDLRRVRRACDPVPAPARALC